MHSELVGIGTDGQLYQWKWASETPFTATLNVGELDNEHKIIIHHPKTIPLQLLNEKICGLSCSLSRGACWTESGKVKKKLKFISIIMF
jgi:E3 ubiquitin-protein ligase EDD1